MKNMFRAFGERAFLYLWLGEIFTQISINLFNFYLILLVFSLTKSNTAVSIVVLTITVPAILFGVLAGVYVDRWNKKKVLFTVNILRALLLIVLALFHSNIIFIYIVSFLIWLLTQFFIPAETPLIPLIVKPKLLLSANALFGLGIYASILIAYVLSGPVIIYFGNVQTLFLLAAMLIIGAIILSFIHLEEDPKKKKPIRATVTREIQRALTLISGSREIHHSLFLLALSQILILIIAVIAPGYANDVLRIPVEQFPFLFVAPAALGVVVGAVVITNFFENASKDKVINVGLFLSGIAMLVLPFGSKIAAKQIVLSLNTFLPNTLDINSIHIVVLIAFLLGFANALVFIPSNTILQEKTVDELRGKVYGVINTIVGIFSLLPIIAVGSLSDVFGVARVIVGIGIVLLVLGLLRVLRII